MRNASITAAVALLVLFVTGCAAEWRPPLDPAAKPAEGNPAARPANYQPDGSYYDWTKTRKPERPFFHHYDQSIVMKIFLSRKANAGKDSQVVLTFEQALDVIKRLDTITCGTPKVIYLVGWQFNGHDSKCPAWSEVNERLKRPEDKTAPDSLRWLIREGRKHHTTVSLHINLLDAYEDSPLWKEYLDNDVLAREKDGKLVKGQVWDGQEAHPINYVRDWETGLAKKRIDALLSMIPELREGHTIHVDAFIGHRVYHDKELFSPWHGHTPSQIHAAMRKYFRYFRDYGIDLTSETTALFRCAIPENGGKVESFIGLQPMSWWWGEPAPGISLPASLYCSTPMKAETEIGKNPKKLPGLQRQFCADAAAWVYIRHWWASLPDGDPRKNKWDGTDWERIRNGADWCVPLPFYGKPAAISFSDKGCQDKTFNLPADWKTVKIARLTRIASDGSKTEDAGTAEIKNGTVTLTLRPGEALQISAVNQER